MSFNMQYCIERLWDIVKFTYDRKYTQLRSFLDRMICLFSHNFRVPRTLFQSENSSMVINPIDLLQGRTFADLTVDLV